MALCYRDVGEIMLRLQQLYAERYGRVVNIRTILGAVKRFRESGSFQPRVYSGRPRHPVRLEEDVLDFFHRHPVGSTADAARLFGVSQYDVWRLLRNERLHPFHYTRVRRPTRAAAECACAEPQVHVLHARRRNDGHTIRTVEQLRARIVSAFDVNQKCSVRSGGIASSVLDNVCVNRGVTSNI